MYEEKPHKIKTEKFSQSNKYETRKKKIDFAKIGEKLSLTGSSCHFCRSIMTVQDSNACRKSDMEKGASHKKKNCNKKFCYDCLQKSFPKYWENRMNKDWKCPCCFNECPCNQCKKIWIKSKNENISEKNEKVNIVNRDIIKNKSFSDSENLLRMGNYNKNKKSNIGKNEKNESFFSAEFKNCENDSKSEGELFNSSNIKKNFNLNLTEDALVFSQNYNEKNDKQITEENLYKEQFENISNNSKTFNIFQDRYKFQSKMIKKIYEKKNFPVKNKSDNLPDHILLNLKRLREQYFSVLEYYKPKLTFDLED